jgi:hypothetical protein
MHLSELRIQLLFPEDIDGQLQPSFLRCSVCSTHTEHTVHCSTTPCLGTGVQLQFWPFHVVISHRKNNNIHFSQTDNDSPRWDVDVSILPPCTRLLSVTRLHWRIGRHMQGNMKSPRAAASSRLFLPTYVCNIKCMNTCIYTKLVYTMKMPTPTGRSGIRWARLGRTLLLCTWPRVLTDQLKADCLRGMQTVHPLSPQEFKTRWIASVP